MSCGQRSQVALGLIMAQDPDLLILDDFSMGLDPGYRRLFVERLQDFAAPQSGKPAKTIFLTSHIIQDMERLITHCMVFDYGRVICQMPTEKLLRTFHRYTFRTEAETVKATATLLNPERTQPRTDWRLWEVYSFGTEDDVREQLGEYHPQDMRMEELNLQDAFIGLTGKY